MNGVWFSCIGEAPEWKLFFIHKINGSSNPVLDDFTALASLTSTAETEEEWGAMRWCDRVSFL